MVTPAAAVGSLAHLPEGGREALARHYICAAEFTLALSAESSALRSRLEAAREREAELLGKRRGLKASFALGAGLQAGANLLRGAEADLAPKLELDAGVAYRYDEVAVLRASSALAAARRRAAQQARADSLAALLAFSKLRAAKLLFEQAHGSAAAAEELSLSAEASAALAHGGAGGLAAAPSEVQLDLRELALAAARSRFAAAGREGGVSDATEELAALGIEAPPPGAPLMVVEDGGCGAPPHSLAAASPPALPEPHPYRSAERELLALSVSVAEARLRRAAHAPLSDLAVTALYNRGGGRVTAVVGLTGGRPGASVAARWRDVNAHNWSVALNATIRVDEGTGSDLAAAAKELAAAKAALERFDAELPLRHQLAVTTLSGAWWQLTFAAEAREIARLRLGAAEGEREVNRAAGVYERALATFERDYQAYLRALERYLGAFDLTWMDLLAGATSEPRVSPAR